MHQIHKERNTIIKYGNQDSEQSGKRNRNIQRQFDTLAAEQAEPTVKELEALASKPMIIDCNALEYVASSGLRVFLRLRKASAANGGQITLLGVNENIMEVLKVTHFDKMFNIQ